MSVCFFCLLRKVARVIAGASDDESDNEPVQSNGPTKAQDRDRPNVQPSSVAFVGDFTSFAVV